MKNQNDITMEKKNRNHKKGYFKILIGFLIILILILTGIIAFYNIKNYQLYQLITSIEEDTIVLYHCPNRLIFWNKTVNYIRENHKEIVFDREDYQILIPSTRISKYYHFSLQTDEKVSNEEPIKDISTFIVDFKEFTDFYATKSITISLPKEFSEKKSLDVYTYQDGKPNIYLKNIKVQNGKVQMDINEEYKQYIITYVPLQDIIIENNVLEVNNHSSLNLHIKTKPENATNRQFHFIVENDALVISEDGVVNTKEAGEYLVQIQSEDQLINKQIAIKVIAVPEKIELGKNSISLKVGEFTNINAKIYPENAIKTELTYESNNTNIASIDSTGNIKANGIGNCEITIYTNSEPRISANVKVEVLEKKTEVGSNVSDLPKEATYIKGVLIANKKYALPSGYNPGVDQTALNAYYVMRDAALQEGFDIKILSSFRSYETQRGLYQRYVNTYGQAAADRFSAQPGKSEHQTGLAFDLGWIDDTYGETAEGKWLAANCYKYGFIIRYPQDKEEITGYMYEPWHVRYLGNPLATEVHNSGLCLEEYLGI